MMEQILVSLGFLLLVYGLYLLINGLDVDPVVKGIVTAAAGIFLIFLGYVLAKRHVKREKNQGGWDYR